MSRLAIWTFSYCLPLIGIATLLSFSGNAQTDFFKTETWLTNQRAAVIEATFVPTAKDSILLLSGPSYNTEQYLGFDQHGNLVCDYSLKDHKLAGPIYVFHPAGCLAFQICLSSSDGLDTLVVQRKRSKSRCSCPYFYLPGLDTITFKNSLPQNAHRVVDAHPVTPLVRELLKTTTRSESYNAEKVITWCTTGGEVDFGFFEQPSNSNRSIIFSIYNGQLASIADIENDLAEGELHEFFEGRMIKNLHFSKGYLDKRCTVASPLKPYRQVEIHFVDGKAQVSAADPEVGIQIVDSVPVLVPLRGSYSSYLVGEGLLLGFWGTATPLPRNKYVQATQLPTRWQKLLKSQH